MRHSTTLLSALSALVLALLAGCVPADSVGGYSAYQPRLPQFGEHLPFIQKQPPSAELSAPGEVLEFNGQVAGGEAELTLSPVSNQLFLVDLRIESGDFTDTVRGETSRRGPVFRMDRAIVNGYQTPCSIELYLRGRRLQLQSYICPGLRGGSQEVQGELYTESPLYVRLPDGEIVAEEPQAQAY